MHLELTAGGSRLLSKCSSLHLLTPNALCIPLAPPPPPTANSLFSVCVNVTVFKEINTDLQINNYSSEDAKINLQFDSFLLVKSFVLLSSSWQH